MNNEFFQVSEKVSSAADKALEKIQPCFAKTDEITEYNQQKVLSAFIKNGVSEAMFAESTMVSPGLSIPKSATARV